MSPKTAHNPTVTKTQMQCPCFFSAFLIKHVMKVSVAQFAGVLVIVNGLVVDLTCGDTRSGERKTKKLAIKVMMSTVTLKMNQSHIISAGLLMLLETKTRPHTQTFSHSEIQCACHKEIEQKVQTHGNVRLLFSKTHSRDQADTMVRKATAACG